MPKQKTKRRTAPCTTNSIIEFIEKDTTKIEKSIKESLLSGNMMRFEEKLLDTVIEFGRNLYQEILESIEQTIRNSEFRRQSYHVEHKEDHRTLLTRFGNIEIKRACYTPKHGGKSIYLLDKYIGMEPNDKVSQAVLAQALREAVETSYRKRRGRSMSDRVCGYKTDGQETDPWSRSGNAGRCPGEKEANKKSSYPGR